VTHYITVYEVAFPVCPTPVRSSQRLISRRHDRETSIHIISYDVAHRLTFWDIWSTFMTTTGFANLLPVWYQQLLTCISHKSRFPDILCLPKNFCNPLTVLAPLKLQPYGAIQICLLLLLLLVPPARPKEALLLQHDAMCQSKSCQLLHISVGTTCMTNPEQIEVSELENYSRPMYNQFVHSATTCSTIVGVIHKVTVEHFCWPHQIHRRLAVAKFSQAKIRVRPIPHWQSIPYTLYYQPQLYWK